MIYCDTSFLLALYVEQDRFYESAERLAGRFVDPIPYTLLGELELLNSIRRLRGCGRIDIRQEREMIEQIETDEAEGILVRMPLNQSEHYRQALDLSRKYTPQHLTRSLDILHVAAAMILGMPSLASFDHRQRNLARVAGLEVLPSTMERE